MTLHAEHHVCSTRELEPTPRLGYDRLDTHLKLLLHPWLLLQLVAR